MSVFKITVPDTKNKSRIAPPPKQLEFGTFFGVSRDPIEHFGEEIVWFRVFFPDSYNYP